MTESRAGWRAGYREIKNSIAEYERNSVRTDKFMEVVRKYQDCEEITTPMLNGFIEKIVVHEADKSGVKQFLKFKIHKSFHLIQIRETFS